ncbi:MAG TPA: hypothetical protein VEZ71_12060, partial [Archangium sp.]|nr:hypothetical protein [Archangium sp.]
MAKPRDTFVVEELNEALGFARLRSESGQGLFHCGLFPEQPGGELSPLRLQAGDKVSGVRRGQTVSEIQWLSRAAPPEALVRRMEELLRQLDAWGLRVSVPPEALAEHHWREGAGSPLLEELKPRLRLFFDWERAHPFEDEGLLRRLVEPLRPHVPELSVEAVASEEQGSTAFRVRPGELELPAPAGTWEHPTPRFEGLVQALNALLERQGAPVRWTRL